MTGPGQDLADLRRDYRNPPLHREDLDADPFAQFDRWFQAARQAGVFEPNAMNVATVDASGQPSSRTVLLKFFDRRGFVFYTNLGSRKARELDANPKAALLFFWPELHRQVQVRGTATRTSATETLGYFMRRPRGSQLGAWISEQSQPITSRQLLEQKFAEISRKFSAGDVPLPSFWGGFRIQPAAIEFWQGQESRLHDRFLYTRTDTGWHIERLAP